MMAPANPAFALDVESATGVDERRAERTSATWGGWIGGVATFGAWLTAVTVSTLHKRDAVIQQPTATFLPQAQNSYNLCYSGNGYWDDINNACSATSKLAVPNVTCAWDKIWFWADRTPQACLEALAYVDATNKYHNDRNNALNYLCFLIATPIVVAVGVMLGRQVGVYGRRLSRHMPPMLGTLCGGNRA